MSSKLTDLQGRQKALQDKMAEVYAQAGADLDFAKVTILGDGDTKAKVEQFNQLDSELNDAARAVEDHQALEARRDEFEAGQKTDKTGRALAGRATDTVMRTPPELLEQNKSLGELFTDSVAYTGKMGSGPGPVAVLPMPKRVSDMHATLFQTTVGWAPETLRSGRVVDFATRPIQVIDLIPSGRTNQAAVVFMEETTLTNAAAETAEAATYPESALALTQRTSPVQKIATFLPVTDEQLEDVDGIQSYVNGRLSFFLRQRLDTQILVGNGTPPNLRGVNNVVGIQTQAKGADPTPDAIYKAMTLVRVTGRADPTGMVVNPTDWQDVKLLRTADGIYIWGSPIDGGPDRIWGMRVVLSDAQTLNTAVLGDFAAYSQLYIRRDVEIQVSNSHSTFFIEGKQAIRADMRVALVFYRPTAFCTVTGI